MEADDGDVVAEADSDGCPLKADSGGVEAEGDEDNRLQSAESGGEASKGDGDGGPLVSDDSVEVARGVENNDVLRFGYEVVKGDRCLRFLLENPKRHRRVWGRHDSCDFVESDVDDGGFRLVFTDEGANLDLRFALRRFGEAFFLSGIVLFEEEEETTDE